MLAGVVAAQRKGAYVAPPVVKFSFLTESALSIVTSSTTRTPDDAGQVAGDLMILCVYARSAITVPEGFVLVQTGNVTLTGTYQVLNVYYKVLLPEDLTKTVTISQATSGRMGISLTIFARSDRTKNISLVTSNMTSSATAPDPNIPAAPVTTTADGQLVLAASTRVLAGSSSDIYTPPAPLVQRSYKTDSAGMRLSVGTGQLAAPGLFSGSFKTSQTAANGSVGISAVFDLVA